MKFFNFHIQPQTHSYRLSVFPHKGKGAFWVSKQLLFIIRELKKFKKYIGLGNLMTYPSWIATFCWRLLISYNPGNLGNWTIRGKRIDNVTGIFEAEVITKMLDLYHADSKLFEGYFTSGATEANIFSSWVGRKYLQRKLGENANIILLRSDLTHYSLRKAADVVGVHTERIAVRDDWQGMDAGALSFTLEKLYKKGLRGFLLPLTLGFTLTGTDDDVETLAKTVERFHKDHPDTHFFLWIDAALAGLVQPFTNASFAPLHNPHIQTFAVDFHKFGKVPLPAGLVLYRKELRKLIERPIDYLTEKDNTLLGSRTGISPVAVWSNIEYLGKEGFVKLVERNLEKKKRFIKTYTTHKDLEVITSPHNLSLAIVIHRRKNYWSEYFKTKYDILFKNVLITFNKGVKEVCIGKAYFIQ